MATNPPPTLKLTPLTGRERTVREQLTTFHLAFVAVDPYVRSQRAFVPVAERILYNFEQADVRVAIISTGNEEETRYFLGSVADKFTVFVDPDRAVVKGFGLERLPAFVHLGQDGTIVGASEGWDPAAWQAIANNLGKMMSWAPPVIPISSDPEPFAGSKVS